MIRCLAAQLEPNTPLSYYINRYDFWDETLEEDKKDNFEERFPVNINLDHTICTYKIMDELNMAAEKRAVAPQLVPVARPQAAAKTAAKKKPIAKQGPGFM